MRVEATYENGKLELPSNIKLRSARVRLIVTIPDAEIEQDTEVPPQAADPRCSTMREEVDAILGPLRGKLGSMTKQQIRDAWVEHLEEKHVGRF